MHPKASVDDHGGDRGAHPRASRATVAGFHCHCCRCKLPALQYDRLLKRKRDIFFTLIAVAAAIPGPQLPLPFSAGRRATCRAPLMTSTPTGFSSASDISSLLPGLGERHSPPLPPHHQRVITPVTCTHATAATDYLTLLCGSSSIWHLFVRMVDKKYLFATSSISLLLQVETLWGCATSQGSSTGFLVKKNFTFYFWLKHSPRKNISVS